MRLLLKNIHRLYGVEYGPTLRPHVAGKDMAEFSFIENAWLLAEDGLISSFGSMNQIPAEIKADDEKDCSGRLVLPSFVDSHTHLVFAAPREGEFVDRINGLSYEEIAARGGGILNSAKRLAGMEENELFDQSLERLYNVISQGTGAIEIKSGYGLNTEAELKMLRVIRRLKEKNLIPVKASFLAAHSYPPAYKNDHEGYLKLIIEEMLPQVANEGLADYMDVFCEQGFFSEDETSRLLDAGLKYGLKPKIHANQLYNSGGVQVGIKHGAVSVDHLECVGDEEIEALKMSRTIPTLLPGQRSSWECTTSRPAK